MYWVMKAYVFRLMPPPPPKALTVYGFRPILSVYIFTPVLIYQFILLPRWTDKYFPQYVHFIFSQVLISYIFSLVLTSYIFCSELTAYILRLADQYRLKKYDFKKSSPGAKRRKFFGPY